MTDDRDWTPTAIPRDRLPRNLRRRDAAERAAQPLAPRCKCSHAKSNHSMATSNCWFGPCGCSTYRPQEDATPAPRTDGGPSIREFLASKGAL